MSEDPALVIDATGLECPAPVLKTQKALRRLRVGQLLRLICTDMMAEIDIPVLLFKTNDSLIKSTRVDNKIEFLIRKN